MRKTYGITELKKNFYRILNNFKDNDVIIITKYGKAIAQIIPCTPAASQQ